MSERNEHTNQIAIKILRKEYADYDHNWWHYDREYRMLIEAQTEAWKQANDAATSQEQALHKQNVSNSALFDASKAILDNIETWLDTGDPADSKTSKMLYDNLKKAIVDFEHCG